MIISWIKTQLMEERKLILARVSRCQKNSITIALLRRAKNNSSTPKIELGSSLDVRAFVVFWPIVDFTRLPMSFMVASMAPGQLHWNGMVVRMTTLIVTGDVNAGLNVHNARAVTLTNFPFLFTRLPQCLWSNPEGYRWTRGAVEAGNEVATYKA